MLTNYQVCILHAGLYIIKYLYILNSAGEIDFKFGQKFFHEKLIDCHHFDLIKWLIYVLQTKIKIFYRLVRKLKTRPMVHLKFYESSFYIQMHFWWKYQVRSTFKSRDMGIWDNLQTGT